MPGPWQDGFSVPSVPGVPDTRSAEITLNATPGTVTHVAMPVNTVAVRLFPRTKPIRVGFDRDPEVVGTSALSSVPSTVFAFGDIVKPDLWAQWTFSRDGQMHELALMAADASVVIDIVLVVQI